MAGPAPKGCGEADGEAAEGECGETPGPEVAGAEGGRRHQPGAAFPQGSIAA